MRNKSNCKKKYNLNSTKFLELNTKLGKVDLYEISAMHMLIAIAKMPTSDLKKNGIQKV